MRSRSVGKRAGKSGRLLVTIAGVASCVGFCCAGFFFATATIGHAQAVPPPVITTNPSSSLTLPQQPEAPVSPTTPGTLPGTTAPNIAVGTNPVTGAPCLGGGASAINGGVAGAPTAPGQPGQPGQAAGGLAPNTSIYSLGNQTPETANPGAC